MAKKAAKSVGSDTMVKFFLKKYSIPTKKDIDKISTRLDRLEVLIKKMNQSVQGRRSSVGPGRPSGGVSASDVVMDVIKGTKEGMGFADIQSKTGFSDKKLRNIIFRLNKLGRIKRKSRGIYVSVS